MLKIYLQVFGTLALALIILLNYNVFVKKPNMELIGELKKELGTLAENAAVLDSILTHRPHFGTLEDLQNQDLDDVKVFFGDTFSEPEFMRKLQKLIDISGCSTNGVIVGNISKVAKPLAYSDFKTRPKENLQKSIESFIETMDDYTGKPAKWQTVVGNNSEYASRLMFYHAISSGKKFPATMIKGLESHRFKLTIKGNYTACKKFLYLIERNRPFTQAVVHSFVPVNDRQGIEKIFSCRLTIVTFKDKNEKMISVTKAKEV